MPSASVSTSTADDEPREAGLVSALSSLRFSQRDGKFPSTRDEETPQLEA